MRKLLTYLSLLSIVSCTTTNPEITFTSLSENPIDSIHVKAGKDCQPLVFKNIKQNHSYKGSILFCNAIKGDGSYNVSLYRNGKITQEIGFGYYTNGSSLNDGFIITVGKMESINVEQY